MAHPTEIMLCVLKSLVVIEEEAEFSGAPHDEIELLESKVIFLNDRLQTNKLIDHVDQERYSAMSLWRSNTYLLKLRVISFTDFRFNPTA